jgi:hypothetical protein
MPKRKGQRKKALAQPKKKRKYAVAWGCATFKSPPPARECPEDDEPIALAASKWKKHKANQKKNNNPIQDQDLSHLKENESNDEENQLTVDDIAKENEPSSDDESENKSLAESKTTMEVESKTMGADSEESANAYTESIAPHPSTNPYFNRPAVSNYKIERSRAAPSVPFSRHAFFLARNDIT